MSDGREDFEELKPPESRYEHYHLGQKEPEPDESFGKHDKPESRQNSFVRNLIATNCPCCGIRSCCRRCLLGNEDWGRQIYRSRRR